MSKRCDCYYKTTSYNPRDNSTTAARCAAVIKELLDIDHTAKADVITTCEHVIDELKSIVEQLKEEDTE